MGIKHLRVRVSSLWNYRQIRLSQTIAQIIPQMLALLSDAFAYLFTPIIASGFRSLHRILKPRPTSILVQNTKTHAELSNI